MTKTSPTKILVADDEADLLSVISDSLTEQGHEVTPAAHGGEADQLISENHFDLIISDIRMPHLSGMKLLEKLAQNPAAPPVILMTGFSSDLENKTAYARGAGGFLTKPFQMEALLRLVRMTLVVSKTKGWVGDAPDRDFVRVPVDEFKTGSQIRSKVYCQLSQHHLTKLSDHGSDIPEKLLGVLRKSPRSSLFVPRADYLKQLGLKSLVEWPHLEASQLVEKKALTHLILEKARTSPFCSHLQPALLGRALDSLGLALDLFLDQPDLRKLLTLMNQKMPEVLQRSVESTALAISVCHQLNWRATSKLVRLGIAGMLQDLSLLGSQIPDKLRQVTVGESAALPNPQEWAHGDQYWLNHPMQSATRVAEFLPGEEEILQIIAQHHERGDGSGFPGAHGRLRLGPLGKVLALSVWINDLHHFGGAASAPRELLGRIVEQQKPAWEAETFEAFRIALTKAAEEKAAS